MAPSAAGAAGPTFEDLERDLQAVLMDQNHHGGVGGASADELSMYRSGSAPPTVQGARAALFSMPPQPQLDSLGGGGGGGGDMLSEEEILSHPAYLQYYYNNEHLNPRLPAPMVSKEDWRAAQRFQTVSGGIGDRRRRPSEAPGGGSSLFSVQPGAREGNGAEFLMSDRMGRSDRNGLARQQSSDWLAQGADGLIGLSDVNGIASRRKSFADALQENISRPGSKAGHLSRSNSRNAFESPNPINLSRSNSRNAFESPNPINLSRSNSRNAFESPNPINLSRSNSRNAFESPNPINLSRSNSRNAFESPNPVNLSRSNSRNAFESPNPIRSSDSSNGQLPSRPESMNGFRSGAASPSLVRVQSLGSSMSHTFSSAVGSSISRNTTPDPQLVQRIPSPCLPPVGVRMGKADRKVEGTGVASHNYDGSDTAAALSAMSNLNLSGNRMTNLETDVQNHIYQNFGDQRDVLFKAPKEHRQFSQQKLVHSADEEPMNALEYAAFPNGTSNMSNSNMSKLAAESKSNFSTQSPHGNANKKESLLSPKGSMYLYQNLNGDSPSGRHTKANSRSSGSSMVNNHLNTDGEYGNLLSSQGGTGFQGQPMDPMYASYLQANPNSPLGAAASMSPFRGSNFSGSGHLDHLDTAGYQKAYLASLLAQQKLQYGMQYLGKSGGLSPTLYGSEQAYGMEMSYLASPRSSPFISSPQGHARQGDRPTRIPSMARSTAVGTMGTWNSENGLIDSGYGSSLLEEFKTNKTRSFELLDIVGHVVEFSSDQYGSRFIQQKLETASTEEKDMIFPEILPQARTLMTDVFGNYVIQKFFEYGTESQQKQLASLLKGYVLTLSLQMYGCRVIQKALEVVEVEQQTQMALELDGTIMKCVRDQNGNHVIQKCIECIPQERIQFIISAFYGHVVDLSTHPYGCRVIQRVLEHCDDESTQSAMMEEIMQSVVPLTQDQYGNYVIQHVLQHGKPEERTSIIRQLAGQIVKMSQQKFASNVVEKCLSFGSREERQILIDEMLGTTDENEPLQAMMKDQFANYVVQKVLETCDDHNRELILSRIKVHLNALKRYTYGKHIVARVEKLIQAGERRIGVSSQSLRD